MAVTTWKRILEWSCRMPGDLLMIAHSGETVTPAADDGGTVFVGLEPGERQGHTLEY
jgi:hypothetical protein